MKVSLNVNHCDVHTEKVMLKLRDPLKKLSIYLTQDYGGIIENLWIDFELSSMLAQSQPPYPFKFQKRVSGGSKIIGTKLPDTFNVGHYSVRPDFKILKTTPDPIEYTLNLIYNSTSVLLEKKNKFPGFNPERFRTEFLKGCAMLGYVLNN